MKITMKDNHSSKYYLLKFGGEVFMFCDQQPDLVKLVNSYECVDRAMHDDYDDDCCNFLIGCDNLSYLENIINDISLKTGIDNFKIDVYDSREHAMRDYPYRKFY